MCNINKINNKNQYNVVVHEVRLSYPHLFRVSDLSKKYEVKLLLDKNSKMAEELSAEIEKIRNEHQVPKDNVCLKEFNQESLSIKATSKEREYFTLLDSYNEIVTEDTNGLFNAGNYVHAQLVMSIVPVPSKGKFLTCWIKKIKFYKKGEPLGVDVFANAPKSEEIEVSEIKEIQSEVFENVEVIA
ncbi:hypothetical protein AB832_07590 [Flavobacteriaceae bacterium (ex Bugula neritina AB1)]|nr:hypothetical protein AB832_07590 [Flavobacteriaceae bacterium (ex Bugula neritina AB1)]